MNKLILFHGTANEIITPTYGLGDDKHDYGKGFYLTESMELAKEWAVCRPNDTNGFVHKYELDIAELKILDFQENHVLAWLAELMKHREAADTKRYRMLAEKFIAQYGVDTSDYDVIKGWRANASYFYIAKEFVRDNIDIDILEFIKAYMASKTRKSIDEAKAYVNTMNAKELWEYFCETEEYSMKPGKALEGFMPDWIGEFYAYYQWYYNIPSAEIIQNIPLNFLKKAYFGLHDLELDLAVQKVGDL